MFPVKKKHANVEHVALTSICYFQVAMDVGQFSEVIRAYHRLLEIRQKHTDVEVREETSKQRERNNKE